MSQLCLVTGATGYIGGRLIPRLLEEGVRVRVLVRHPERISQHPWHDQVEIISGTADDPETCAQALRDVDVAYYLIHAIGSSGDFEETDQFLSIYSPDPHQNLDLVVTTKERSVPRIFGDEYQVQVTGIAIVENQR
jgi:uncharacterized protein YbjT (DUF2867 family)